MTSENQREAIKTVPADVSSADADGTYSANEQTLINELKTKLNALMAVVRRMG